MIGEIRMFGGSFNPNGWALCSGAPIPISENDALFTIIGTTYGGDGQTYFNLPNLQSRIPMHRGTGPGGNSYIAGEMAGTEQETITTQQMPIHTHPAIGSAATGSSNLPNDKIFAVPGITPPVSNPTPYGSDAPFTALNPASITPVGGSQPHENTQPFMVITFIISLFGIFPRWN
jgi:microcystin-dependent protein